MWCPAAHGPCKDLLPEVVQHSAAAVLVPQAAPRSVARTGVQCLTHLHRSHPGRNKSVHFKNTPFFSCDNKCSSPAWTPADPAPSSPGAGDPWSCEHLWGFRSITLIITEGIIPPSASGRGQISPAITSSSCQTLSSQHGTGLPSTAFQGGWRSDGDVPMGLSHVLKGIKAVQRQFLVTPMSALGGCRDNEIQPIESNCATWRKCHLSTER